MQCSTLLPSHNVILIPFGSSGPGCLLPEGHQGEHLSWTFYDGFHVWSFERCSDCEDPECFELMECFVHIRISTREAVKLLCWGVDCPPVQKRIDKPTKNKKKKNKRNKKKV